jgi:Tfp pilus assembly protein FimT
LGKDLKRGTGGLVPQVHRNNSGVSIVELLLIIAIMIVLYAIFVPRYTYLAIRKHEVYSTAHDLAADIAYARRLTLGGGPTGNSGKVYWIKLYKVGAATDTWRIFESNNEAQPIKSVTVLNGVYLKETATSSFYFDIRGATYPYNGGAVEVHDNEKIYQWDVSVVRGTGRVKLIER